MVVIKGDDLAPVILMRQLLLSGDHMLQVCD